MNKQKIKQLAILTAQEKNIPQDVQEYVLTYFTKQELKNFMNYYLLELEKKRVYVSTPIELTAKDILQIKQNFPQKEIITTLDRTLGAGLSIRQNDTIMDFTIKSLIQDTIEALKN